VKPLAAGMRPPPPERTVLRTAEDFRLLWPGTALEAHAIELVAIDEHRCVLALPVTDAVRQPAGLLHGGMSMMLAESAASLHACWGVDLSQRAPVGIEINGSHVRALAEGRVRATATVVRRTSALVVHQVEIADEASGALLSTGRVTNFYRRVGEPRADPPVPAPREDGA
jgi:1,4-dihydroxy-2-naphthoyl-CoA hydrolase